MISYFIQSVYYRYIVLPLVKIKHYALTHFILHTYINGFYIAHIKTLRKTPMRFTIAMK